VEARADGAPAGRVTLRAFVVGPGAERPDVVVRDEG
jgi:hypothetical protein